MVVKDIEREDIEFICKVKYSLSVYVKMFTSQTSEFVNVTVIPRRLEPNQLLMLTSSLLTCWDLLS